MRVMFFSFLCKSVLIVSNELHACLAGSLENPWGSACHTEPPRGFQAARGGSPDPFMNARK